VQLLRATLNKEGYDHIRIVAPDAQSWDLLKEFDEDTDYLNAVDIIGFVLSVILFNHFAVNRVSKES